MSLIGTRVVIKDGNRPRQLHKFTTNQLLVTERQLFRAIEHEPQLRGSALERRAFREYFIKIPLTGQQMSYDKPPLRFRKGHDGRVMKV